MTFINKGILLVLALVDAVAFGVFAGSQGEPVNAIWLLTAAVCTYAIGYRFYSRWLVSRVLGLEDRRKTPAHKLDNGRDYVPTTRWVVFGHHFAAIAGAGPLEHLHDRHDHPDRARGRRVHAPAAPGQGDGSERDWRGALAPRAGGQPVGRCTSGLGASLHFRRHHARLGAHRLRLRRLGLAGVAASGPARLPLDLREDRQRGAHGRRHRRHRSQLPALTRFVDGTGPVVAGGLFPFATTGPVP